MYRIMILMAAAAILGACGNDAKSTPAPDVTKAAPTQAPVKPTATAIPPTIGLPANQAQVGNLLLTVNGAAPYADELFPAEPGTHYIAVDITARNTGTKTYTLNRFNFRLKDSDKFTADPALTHGPEPGIGSHDMVPGQEVRGFLVFKLGDTRTPVELQYQSFTGSATTIPIQ